MVFYMNPAFIVGVNTGRRQNIIFFYFFLTFSFEPSFTY